MSSSQKGGKNISSASFKSEFIRTRVHVIKNSSSRSMQPQIPAERLKDQAWISDLCDHTQGWMTRLPSKVLTKNQLYTSGSPKQALKQMLTRACLCQRYS